MEIPKDQIDQLKKQVLDQINSTFPEDKKQSAIQQVNSMNEEEFIEFLKQNNLIKSSSESENQNIPQETPFRQIIQGKIPSYKISENEKALAVLEINPISTGHSIVIPKEQVDDPQKLPEVALDLAKEISETIKEKLKPSRVLIEPSNVLGEIIINLIPVYKDENSDSERKSAKPEELEELQKTLEELKNDKEDSKEDKVEELTPEKIILPKRIP